VQGADTCQRRWQHVGFDRPLGPGVLCYHHGKAQQLHKLLQPASMLARSEATVSTMAMAVV
jgi:hypothetical protein